VVRASPALVDRLAAPPRDPGPSGARELEWVTSAHVETSWH
jgi:hypothetical protein